MAPLNLPIGATGISVKVQPGVLFSICDAYIRRSEGQDRVIGTLVGSIAEGVLEVKNCYAVPHKESYDTVEMDIMHHKTLVDLHAKVNPKEVVVGWYSTGTGVSGSDALIQEFYSGECTNPVHLTVDTTLQNKQLSISAYVSRTLTLGKKALASEFLEVSCEVRTSEVEKVGVELLETEITDKIPTDIEGLHASFGRLQESLERTYNYVDDVVKGRRKADLAIGRYLADTVAAVPFISKEEFEQLFNDSAQDVMLIMYLSNLVQAQIALADKLGTAALPIL
ncbi:hypothetical protein WJX72_008550 [[Myrmecia] bisecta]|uniref:Eukaryotic translation initiation factor 3 subunit F n=1 Tax=[Myrmecia] bisecta TaxID=41462 RepID=A0AAW1QFU8_9CHLO